MIHFTQFVRPNGRQQITGIDRPPDVEAQAAKIIAAGGRFEIEVLTTGEISLEAVIDEDDDIRSLAIEICENGPEVPLAVDRLVAAAALAIANNEVSNA